MPTPSHLIETFSGSAKSFSAQFPFLNARLDAEPKRNRMVLTIPKQNAHGFDVALECETYGLYPTAGDWHGAPWDVTTPGSTEISLVECAFGWMKGALSPTSRLRVLSASGRPYCWKLEYRDGEVWRLAEAVGLPLWRFWGSRSEQVFQNHHLPALASLAEPVDRLSSTQE
jgi:hypothetical protein